MINLIPLLWSGFPLAAMLIGATISLFRPPPPAFNSILQHFAAGVVFSVCAVELLPEIIKRHEPGYVILGFMLGVAAMLLIRSVTGSATGEEGTSRVSIALIAAIGVDVLLDGFLIGIGQATGEKQGLLLTAALTTELLSLGLAVALELKENGLSRKNSLKTIFLISLLLPIGATLGLVVLSHVPSFVMETVLSFGLAALLFLVTEELLLEAHQEPETPVATASFFFGFLIFLILGMLS